MKITTNYWRLRDSNPFPLWSVWTMWQQGLVNVLSNCILISPCCLESATTSSIHCGAWGLSFINFRLNSSLVWDFMPLSLWISLDLQDQIWAPYLCPSDLLGNSPIIALISVHWDHQVGCLTLQRLWALETRASILLASLLSVPSPAPGTQGYSSNTCWTNEWISGFPL